MTAVLERIKSISSLFLCLLIFFKIFKLCTGSEFESHVLCCVHSFGFSVMFHVDETVEALSPCISALRNKS